MIALLLAFVNFVVTVAIHVAEISVKVAIKAIQMSAKVGSKVAKKGAKAGVKVAKKGAEVGKEVAKKGAEVGKNVAKETVEDAKAISKGNTTEKESAEEETKKRRVNSVVKKVLSLKLLQKALHTAVFLLRASLVCVVVYLFVLTTLVVTGTLALTASAGYVALAYNNGVLGTTEDSDSSFDITKDGKEEDKDSSKTNFVKGDTSTLEGKLETLAKWYLANIHTYGKNKYTLKTVKANDLMDGLECRNDCTGFARAFVNYVNGNNKTSAGGSSAFVKGWNATDNGWTYYETKDLNSLDDLQLGDILIANSTNASKAGTISGKGHHAEVFIDKKHSFGWGKVQAEYPLSKDWNFTKNSQGRNVVTDSGHIYVCFYRHTGK